MNRTDDPGLAHMQRVLELAARGRASAHPNPCVGAVLVRDGEVVGEGWHRRAGEAHAEALALESAGADAADATLYINLEPCCHQGRTPPCVDAVIEAGVARVVIAMADPDPRVSGGGIERLREAGIEVEVGLCEQAARELNAGFITRHTLGRPRVTVKLAVSLDGATAMADGESRWISSEAARADVQRMRSQASAIVSGSGTVLTDDPRLSVRLEDTVRHPLRVILDGSLVTPTDARLFDEPGEVLILCVSEDSGRAAGLVARGARVERMPAVDGQIDLVAVLMLLGTLEVNEVLVEAGSTLCGALLAADLVDELVVYQAPVIMGEATRRMFEGVGIAGMSQRRNFVVVDVGRIGPDVRIVYHPGPLEH